MDFLVFAMLLALEYASKDLRNDREIVLTACSEKVYGMYAIKHASDNLRNDRELILSARKKRMKSK